MALNTEFNVNSGILPRRRSEVEQVLENLSAHITPTMGDGNDVANELINRLTALKVIAETNEKRFYEMSATKDIRGLEDLQARLDNLNSGVFGLFMDNSSEKEQEVAMLIHDMQLELAESEITQVLTDSNEIKELLKEKSRATAQDLLEVLNELLLNTGRKKSYFINSTSRGIVGKIEGIVRSEKDGTVSVTWKQDNESQPLKLSHETYNKVIRTLGGKKLTSDQKAEILIKVLTEGKSINQDIKTILEDEIRRNIRKYDINIKATKLLGFLGELYSAVAFRYLFNDKQVEVTGGLRAKINNLEGGKKETGLDLIVDEFAMQIKRYRYINNDASVVSFTNGDEKIAKLPVFLSHIPNLGLTDALKLFFGSMLFNLPIADDQISNLTKNGGHTEFAGKLLEGRDAYANEVYSRFTDAYESQSYNGVSFQSLFTSYTDRIIRLDQNIDFEGKIKDMFSSMLVDKDSNLYINTFFLISGKIIPSSAILQALIDATKNQLQGKPNNRIFTTSFTIQKRDLSSNLCWSLAHQESSQTLAQILENVDVHYQIDLNLENIVQQARQASIRV